MSPTSYQAAPPRNTSINLVTHRSSVKPQRPGASIPYEGGTSSNLSEVCADPPRSLFSPLAFDRATPPGGTKRDREPLETSPGSGRPDVDPRRARPRGG